MDPELGAARSEDPDAAQSAPHATRDAASALLARDRPILGHDVDPGLTRVQAHRLAACVAERKDIEDVGSRPGDVLPLPIAEHRAVACSDERHVELRVAGGIQSEVRREVDLGLYDDGATWTSPIQVNDNASAVDEFQPNLDVAADGTVSVAFYDRRLACPAAGTAEAAAAGLALDTANVNYSGTLPPYGAANYCVNASIQFYTPTLAPKGHNIRLTQHTWDPQLHSPHTSCPTCRNTFIGDYFGIASGSGMSYTTSVTTYNDGTNPSRYQQQVIAILAIP